ncbi:MAG: hypothetical protein WBH44_09750 [Proteocatella sp.]
MTNIDVCIKILIEEHRYEERGVKLVENLCIGPLVLLQIKRVEFLETTKDVTGNATQSILINHGFKDVSNLSGGHTFYKATK